MATTRPLLPAPTPRPHTQPLSGLAVLIRRRSVQAALGCWLVVNVVLVVVSGGHLPFRASSLARPPSVQAVLRADAMFVEVFGLMLVVHLLTRRRRIPDISTRSPAPARARVEVAGMLAYGVAAMVGGFLLGRGLGWHAFSFHLDGMVIRTGQPVTPVEAVCWAGYGLVVYAAIPLALFRRRYSAEQLSLRSSDRRADVLLILVVLGIEGCVQLLLDHQIFSLSLHQLVLGAPLTFVLSFAGTVLPTMVFVYCILTPRYLRLTGSLPATLVLGGVTYALLHFFDGWTNFATPTDAVLSVLYLLLFYTGPGMFKTFLTVRTANAWTHVWAYHAIAPHTLVDTPMFVRIFGIR